MKIQSKAYGRGLTVSQYVKMMRKHYSDKIRNEMLIIIGLGMAIAWPISVVIVLTFIKLFE